MNPPGGWKILYHVCIQVKRHRGTPEVITYGNMGNRKVSFETVRGLAVPEVKDGIMRGKLAR